MKVRVLKELPQGQQPGAVIDITDDEARVLMTPGVDAVEPAVVDIADPVPAPRRAAGGRYQRRDLQAEPRDAAAED